MGTHVSGNLVFVSSSSSGSERGGRGPEGVSADASSNGCPGTLRKTHHIQRGPSPLADDDGDDDVRSTVIPPFPMSRIRRLIRSEGEIRTTQDAVFLINNALEQFIKLLAEDSYVSAVQEKKSSISYKHLSLVVRRKKKYEFLIDSVPEKLRAEVALSQQEQSIT
ncbi:DNA polymerase II subunit B3-1 isoform X2 [Nymphaea colorata]|uniref:DNA polymerase II subunit B3-1 isoform X2 n=1 Tax=Nymphaea colorata TaxID=210225 RepID=UPI00129E179E|nr:DNA polymerase II subunit B3-1 isoform X2 [Nymphaea colorata]